MELCFKILKDIIVLEIKKQSMTLGVRNFFERVSY